LTRRHGDTETREKIGRRTHPPSHKATVDRERITQEKIKYPVHMCTSALTKLCEFEI
jgi:hypothetical protein